MTRHPLKFSILAIAFLMTVTVAVSQSGRRLPNSKSAAPAPSPEPEASPSPTPRPEIPPAFTMIVGAEPDMAFDNTAMLYVSTALDACAKRLDRPTSVEVQGVDRNMSRGQAIKRAKESSGAHVVWLHLRTDDMGAQASSSGRDIFIEYVVYAPGGKTVTSGRTSQGNGKSSSGIPGVSLPRNSAAYREALIREAAEVTADRILSALDVPVGRSIPPFTYR
jgi:hypothetical protein